MAIVPVETRSPFNWHIENEAIRARGGYAVILRDRVGWKLWKSTVSGRQKSLDPTKLICCLPRVLSSQETRLSSVCVSMLPVVSMKLAPSLPEMYLVAMASDPYCYCVASIPKENETLGRYKFIQLSEDTWRNTLQISVKTICFSINSTRLY